MPRQEIPQGRNWYAIHTYSGYEEAVARNLKQRIESLGMEDKIFNVVVPIEKKIKIKSGKRVEEGERVYPGYVLVDMIVDDDSWYIVRNTPRVTGFVGTGVYPTPLNKGEIKELFDRMYADTTKHTIDFSIDEPVIITEGPFKDQEGKVNAIDEARGTIKVLVSMFGREVPVEIDPSQVKKL